jgi:subtilisin family serine protease
MRVSIPNLFRGVISLTLAVNILNLAPAATTLADDGVLAAPPDYLQMVHDTGAQTWEQRSSSSSSGPQQVTVHLNMTPLAMVDRRWSPQQRLDYVAQIQSAQEALAAQVAGLGGTVVGRFKFLSTGLAVTIDASQVTALQKIAGVAAVHATKDYALDLSETVGWIGGRKVQAHGVDGQGVNVAVIDSGIDYSHKKLGGGGTPEDYARAYCGSPTDIPGGTPCGNAHSLPDATGQFPNGKVKGGHDFVGEAWPRFPGDTQLDPDPNPIDFEGHGTHVADIIAGLASAPNAGDAGVAPGANLYAFKACSAVATSCNGHALLLALEAAMDLDNDPGTYDPADVINLSLGSPYGQPEDDLTMFANLASYYGSLVVAAAGNSGDRPYIVSSPSSASAALSVAQTTVPSDKLFTIRVKSKPETLVPGALQPWSPPVTGQSGKIQYGDGTGGNLLGCDPFPANSLNGKVLVVDRGTCAVSLKAANGSAGGAAFVIVVNNQFSNTPPIFAYGGGVVTVPTLTVTQHDGTLLKTLIDCPTSINPNDFVALPDDIVASSARGPRINDSNIKPDLAAPGASVSAEVGTGTGQTAFGGTSGATPMVSGAAALTIQRLRDRGILPAGPGLTKNNMSQAPLLKALLMNTANPDTYIGGSRANGGRGFLAPITLQGAGRVDAWAAHNADAIAWDATDFVNLPSDATGCQVDPGQLLNFIFLGQWPPCATYPFGNPVFNAWNAMTGSLSFGYEGVSSVGGEIRQIAILNLSDRVQTFKLDALFRYREDKHAGVSIHVWPKRLEVPPGEIRLAEVAITINANHLRDWTLDSGQFGASGTNIYCQDPNPQRGCPTLTMFEYDGFVTIRDPSHDDDDDDDDEDDEDDVAESDLRLAWQILPKKVANVAVTKVTNTSVRLRNNAVFKPGDVDVFSLIEINANRCELQDSSGNCINADYVPGIFPGTNASPVDIHEVGVRSYVYPGVNAQFGFPPAPDEAINDEVVEFGLTVYDLPYRASHNYPVEFDIFVDVGGDSTPDYLIFTGDLNLNATDGRNAVFACPLIPGRPTCQPGTLRPYFYTNTDFNSQNWMLPVPAAAIGTVSTQPFRFFVLAYDSYFGGLWDCSPVECTVYHTYQTALPKYRPQTNGLQVPKLGSYTLAYSQPEGGAAASPSQTGLLFLYRDARIGFESESITLTPP